jgi:hypothetical protein
MLFIESTSQNCGADPSLQLPQLLDTNDDFDPSMIISIGLCAANRYPVKAGF